jgi:sugar lactone lactonase YvrE
MKLNFITLMVVASLTSLTAQAAKPVFYPAAPEQPRIQFLKSINGANFFVGGNGYGNRFPGYETPESKDTNPIMKPYGVTVTQGKIFVCDPGSATVKIFDLDKKFVTSMGDQKVGKLKLPLNIAVDADGTRFVADGSLNKIMVFDANNVFVKSMGNAESFRPTDLVISKGNLYITDAKNSQVIVMNPKTGAEVSRFSQAGVEASDLMKATNLTTDTTGNIMVSDTIGGKISTFTNDGKFIRSMGTIGDKLGQFSRPKGIAVDRQNNLYAVDAAFENVQVFDNQGRLLMPFGEVGNVPGGLNMPAKIAVDYSNVKYFKDAVAPGYAIDYLIFITSQFGNNRVNVYAFLKKI